MRLALTFLLFMLSIPSVAQPTQANLTIPPNACLQERIKLKNSSTNATQYFWDFCGGDLKLQPTANVLVNSFGGYGTRVEVVESAGEFFGFFLSGGSKALFKLEFGADLNSTPTLKNLGDLGLSFIQLRAIDIVFENQLYYGFIVDSQNNAVYRIDFGNSLDNIPQNAVQVFSGAPLNAPFQISSVSDGSLKYLFIANSGDGNLVRLRFTNSYSESVAESYSIGITSNWINAISFLKEAGTWHCLTGSPLLSEVQKIDFQNGLDDNSPVVTSIPIPSNPMGIELVNENGSYYAFAQTQNSTSSIYRLNFGSSIGSSPQSIAEIVNIGYGNSVLWNFSMMNSKSTWVAFATESIGSNIYRLNFPNNCLSTIETSTQAEPKVYSSNTGTFIVSLTAGDLTGNNSYESQSIVVSGLVASDIDFASQNVCVNNPVNYTSLNKSGNISSYSWDFGNSTSSSQPNPSAVYSSAGLYITTLTVTASNGCTNFAQDSIEIFNQPQANFTLPSASPICTNQNYQFLNTSTFDAGSNSTWQWSVNGTNVATTQDLNYLITTTSPQNISLSASIPGCSSQSTQSITTVQDGPLVDFTSPAAGCLTTAVSFTNATSGSVTGYQWTFGDGNSSTQTNASNTYMATGTYGVTLTTSNAAGCQNFLTKNISVYSNPQPDFAVEAPPFSCANYPAQFDNNTPSLSDSNITTWAWGFGDAANGTSNQKNPTYTFTAAATYNVTLQATTNFGCTGTKQQSVVINPSPVAAFSNNPACVNQATQFTDASTGNITSYKWTIQGTTLTGATPPPYVFKSSGTFPVTLTTTGTNGCKNIASKDITVPVPPVMDFAFQPPCSGKPTIFQELNPGGSDPSTAWNWNFGSDSGVDSPVSYSFTTAGVYSVTLSATRKSGCVYSTSKNITIHEGPVARFSPSVQAGPAPLTVAFNNTSTADSYFWQMGDGAHSTSSDFSPTFTYTQLGQYKALLTAGNSYGCTDTLSSEIYVVVPHIDLAMSTFSILQDPGSNSSKAVVTILNLGNIPFTNPEVLIDLGGNAKLKEKIEATLLPGKSVQQTLSLEIVPQTLGYICAEVAPTGDVDIYNDRQCLSLTGSDVLYHPYPNPADGQLNFDWISAENENVIVTIYKSTGQVAFEQSFQLVSTGINQLAINTSSLAGGLYLIQFSGAKAKKTFSVMVAHE